MSMFARKRVSLVYLGLLLCLVSLFSGCTFDIDGPTYTKSSIPIALKQYGITAHYTIDQGNGKLLTKATGQRYLLQIDYIDQYEVKDGWVEVYLYPDAQQAYEDALIARKTFDDRFRFDQKVAELQGKEMEKPSLPLFQHGNVIIFAAGIADDQEAIQRLSKTFGDLKRK
ncbi:MAG: hypothetical protein ACXVOI_03910 [Tumebacillaceae bacterium]